MTKESKVFLDLIAFIDNRKRKIGYAYGTEKGNICIKADKMMDAAMIGRLLKGDGLHIMDRRKSQNKEVKAFFDLIGYINGKKKKVGYAFSTKIGSICIKADEMMDGPMLGRFLKNDGLYVMDRIKNKYKAA